MNILGIHIGHNSTVSLIKDNKLRFTISEEKFTNIKNCAGFPKFAMDYILKQSGMVEPSDLDGVMIAGLYFPKTAINQENTEPSYGAEPFIRDKIFRAFQIFDRNPMLERAHIGITEWLYKKKLDNQHDIREYISKEYGISYSAINFIHHHTAHAYSPIGFYNLHDKRTPTLVFTQDGCGDTLSGSVGIYANGGYSILDTTSFNDSIANLYSAVTMYLGMKMLNHEYKVMGLSAYPNPKYAQGLYERKFRDLVSVRDGKISLKIKNPMSHVYMKYILKDLLLSERFDNIAYAVQMMLEEKMAAYVSENVEKYKIRDIACAGGLFMNIKMNKRLQELPGVDMCYFMPSACDESLSIGAATAMLETSGHYGTTDETAYLGVEYSDKDIEDYFSGDEGKGFEIYEPSDVEKEVANMVSEGQIVGRFAGRGEWGARSLGNRAILADPSRLESIETINNTIKCRDFWMPFACSVLDGRFSGYCEFNGKSHPYYMITSYDSKPQARMDLKAGLHRKDYTMRPNVVLEKHNKKYHNLLKHFEELTGIGGLLNTSLNIHGYPLVGLLPGLAFTMRNSDLKVAQCGSYIVRKVD